MNHFNFKAALLAIAAIFVLMILINAIIALEEYLDKKGYPGWIVPVVALLALTGGLMGWLVP